MHEREAGRLRRAIKDGAQVWYKRHAHEEMVNDEIYEIDIENMLARCRVTFVEFKRDELWRAEAVDIHGRTIVAIVHLDVEANEIHVVTVWAKREAP